MKKAVAATLDDETYARFKVLCKREKRSAAGQIEWLILEAIKGIPMPVKSRPASELPEIGF